MRLVALCLLAGLMIWAAEVPLATFAGKVHGVTNKQITIENAEGNLVDFDINKKTKITRGKKEIAAKDIESGDFVTIEAKQEMARFLVAITIVARPKE